MNRRKAFFGRFQYNLYFVTYVIKLTELDVMDDFENKRSFSLNFLFLLSVLEAFLFIDRYRSHPLIMFPYKCVSSRYDPSKAYICRSRLANVS